MENWIKVEHELPAEGQQVKIKSDDFWRGEANFKNSEFIYSWVNGACFGEITHWMPIDGEEL